MGPIARATCPLLILACAATGCSRPSPTGSSHPASTAPAPAPKPAPDPAPVIGISPGVHTLALLNAEEQAREVAEAMLREDYRGVIRGTYPKVVEMVGGAARMEKVMARDTAKMKEDGITFEKVTVAAPTWSDFSGARWYVVLPETITLRTPKFLLVQESHLLGVSDDAGATWHFIDTAGLNEKAMKMVLPDAPATLVLPKRQPPRQQPLP